MNNIFSIGFMLFAVFFGAGNLIFPPQLGAESGANYLPALMGFLVTAVGLPVAGLLLSSATPGSAIAATRNVHPLFSLIMVTLVFVIIGPMFAIPRTGATAYAMGISPFLGSEQGVALLLWTLAYFGISCALSLNPSKLVDRVGQVLTPVLLLAILVIIVRGAFFYGSNSPELPLAAYEGGKPFFTGLLEGYKTMDAFAVFNFALIVSTAVQQANPENTSRRELLKQSAAAGLIAGALLIFVYGGLAWMGAHMGINAAQIADLQAKGETLGTWSLGTSAQQIFGGAGQVLLGVIVTLACLTTSVGLTVATAQYLSDTIKGLDYKKTVIGISVFSLLVANQGLSALIKFSIPILLVLYPMVIAITAMMLLARFVKTPRLSWQLGVGLTLVMSLLSTANSNGWLPLGFMEKLPLAAQSFEWLPFMLLGVALGWAFGGKGEMVDYSPQANGELEEE